MKPPLTSEVPIERDPLLPNSILRTGSAMLDQLRTVGRLLKRLYWSGQQTTTALLRGLAEGV